MERKCSCQTDLSETKSDIIAFAFGNPANRSYAKLSRYNEHFLGTDLANLLTKRYNNELQRCAQYYSLASLFNETSTKDKHRFNKKNMKKISTIIRESLQRIFSCSQQNKLD